MNKKEFVESVQLQISQANTGEALQTMVGYFNAQPKYRRLETIALKAQALYNKTTQDESRGVISFEQAKLNNNIVTDTVLKLLEDVEQNNLSPSRYQIEKDQTARWQLIVSFLTLLVIVGGFGFWMYKNNSSDMLAIAESDCPEFKTSSKFNIMVLPFENLDGSADKPHIKIRTGLVQKIVDYDLVNLADVQTNLNRFPQGIGISVLEAGTAGQDCKASLVMWGTAEQIGDEKEITANYKLIDKDQLDLTLLKLKEADETIERVDKIANIKPEGVLIKNVDLIIKAFFGLLNHQLNRPMEAIENLKEVVGTMDPFNPKDTSNFLVFSNILAQDYLKTDQKDSAIATYEVLLAAHPNYQLANVNQAILLYDKKRYSESIKRLNMAIEKEPTNEELWLLRGNAHLRNDQLIQARDDYQQVQKITPGNKSLINRKIRSVDREIQRREQIIDPGMTTPAATNNLSALENTASASRSIGNYAVATSRAQKMIRMDPDNLTAHKILIEDALVAKKDTARARSLLDQAKAAGVPPDSLYQAFPALKPRTLIYFRPKLTLPLRRNN